MGEKIPLACDIETFRNQASQITKRRPQGVSKDAPSLLVLSLSGRHWMESLATAANA